MPGHRTTGFRLSHPEVPHMNAKSLSLILAIVAFNASIAFAQTDFFWSFNGLNSGATNSDEVSGVFNTGATGTLYLYYSTANSELDTGAGLDLSWSNNDLVRFTAAQTFDFDVVLASDNDVVVGTRWGDAFGPAADVQDDAVTGLNAFTVVAGDGIINANDGSGAFLDQGYDAGADAYLFASVDFEIVGLHGVSLLRSVEGDIGIVHDGSTINPSFGSARFINFVLPEPTSASLLAIGLIGLVARRRR